jgi:hypothetical protein
MDSSSEAMISQWKINLLTMYSITVELQNETYVLRHFEKENGVNSNKLWGNDVLIELK